MQSYTEYGITYIKSLPAWSALNPADHALLIDQINRGETIEKVAKRAADWVEEQEIEAICESMEAVMYDDSDIFW